MLNNTVSLKPAAVALLAKLPRFVSTISRDFPVALALRDMDMVSLSGRTVFRNGRVRYWVSK